MGNNFWSHKNDYFYLWLNIAAAICLLFQVQNSEYSGYLWLLAFTAIGGLCIKFSDTFYRYLTVKNFNYLSGDIVLYSDHNKVIPVCIIRNQTVIVFKRMKPITINLNEIQYLIRKDNASKSIKMMEKKGGLRLEHSIDAGKNKNEELFHLIELRVPQKAVA